ncbi:MAG: hypothetical protein CVU42_04390 [Chloroflexi bacterium HGW-Chloroflexi-4]|jgi:hypothetical protein|nr:MAG: hypothetical protein CVU42_04390 [Chloroflexi bacterium HGW-Chloroflexi-4]
MINYEIIIKESLDASWSHWFEGLNVQPLNIGNELIGTVIQGSLPDQAALFGVLSQVRDLNLTLLEVKTKKNP